MDKIKFGEEITLEDNREYVCFGTYQDYVYLVSSSKPVSVVFARQVLVDNNLTIEIVEDPEVKEQLYTRFKKDI